MRDEDCAEGDHIPPETLLYYVGVVLVLVAVAIGHRAF
jgi:hypothetical protein